HLNVPRNYFEIIDMDAATTGLQPFADSTGAFRTPSTIAQNDTTQGTDQFIKLNFVESIINGEVIGNSLGDSSQVAAQMKLLVKQYAGGAPLDTSLVWSMEAGRKTGFRRGKVELAAPAREGFITLTPGARLIVTAPLEGRSNYADTLDLHLRQIGSTHDITNQVYIGANDVVLDTISSSTDLDLSGVSGTFVASETVTGGTSSATGTVTVVNGTVVSLSPVTGTFSVAESVTGGTSNAAGSIATISVGNAVLGDSVQVVSDAFGTITLTEIPAGTYELTVKADGYISGRTDTLDLFNGMTLNPDPTFGSDVLGNLSPATPLGFLRGGDATGDNQVDIADANLVFSIWNQTPADAGYVRGADVNADGVVNSIDLGFVTANFGNDGFGAPPVFKRVTEAGDNSVAVVEVKGVEEVDAWWPGRVFEVTTRVTGMSDVMAYDLAISYDPDRVKPLSGGQAVSEGDVFAENARGTLFFQRAEPGLIEVAAGRVGRDMTASGDADLVTVRFVTLADDPGLIEVVSGQLVNSAYQGVDMRVKKAQALPQIAALHQNFPNPFNPSTEIRFDIPTARNVKLRVYNQLGQTVRTLVQSRMKAGTYRIKWDGRTEAGHGVSSGVYFYSLEAGQYSQIRKMTLVK
ncbi:MAG: T9SS type A sorting domain-containing protein, partial [Gemmatimonadetes bacterium]|nr:T9SS type A sorting domain-containing protein [Gemmatimonadota bacterium]